MRKTDKRNFSNPGFGTETDYYWEDPYVGEFDFEADDQYLPFDDEDIPEIDDAFLDDDTLFEEE
jgi:hypothetical protein